jgi:hypothetical protein
MIPMSVRIQVFSYELSLKGVPKWVTRLFNNVILSTSCISYVYVSPTVDL